MRTLVIQTGRIGFSLLMGAAIPFGVLALIVASGFIAGWVMAEEFLNQGAMQPRKPAR